MPPPNVLRWKASTCFFLLSLSLSCAGQGNRRFGWKFNGQNGYSTSLPTCQEIPLLVQPWNLSDPTLAGVTGVPPYFMLALPVGGTPRLYPIGSDPTKLSWTPDFPPSTELVLTIIDSNNTAGGVPTDSFQVVSGQNEGCVIQPPSDPTFNLKTNVTGVIPTCAPWGVTVSGGVPPYNWTLAQIGSPVVTNVTGTMNDDELVYIMRGDQNRRLFVAASDATGRWAHGIGEVTPRGSDDVSCIGWRTVTGNSTVFAEQLEASRKKAEKEDRNRTIAIAVPVSIVGAILIGLAIWLFIRHRRKQKSLRPHVFNPEPKIEMGTPVQTEFSPYTGYTTHRSTAGSTILSYDPSGRPLSSDGPTSPTSPTYSKAGEAHMARHSQVSNDGHLARYSQAGSSSGVPASSSGRPASRFHEEDEVVIQHTDAGGVVRELPPPYADRMGESRRSPRDPKLTPQNEI